MSECVMLNCIPNKQKQDLNQVEEGNRSSHVDLHPNQNLHFQQHHHQSFSHLVPMQYSSPCSFFQFFRLSVRIRLRKSDQEYACLRRESPILLVFEFMFLNVLILAKFSWQIICATFVLALNLCFLLPWVCISIFYVIFFYNNIDSWVFLFLHKFYFQYVYDRVYINGFQTSA